VKAFTGRWFEKMAAEKIIAPRVFMEAANANKRWKQPGSNDVAETKSLLS
jgi:hypothetical protein